MDRGAIILERGRELGLWLWLVILHKERTLDTHKVVPIYDQSQEKLRVGSFYAVEELAILRYGRRKDNYGKDWWIILGCDSSDVRQEVYDLIQYNPLLQREHHYVVHRLLTGRLRKSFLDNQDSRLTPLSMNILVHRGEPQ